MGIDHIYNQLLQTLGDFGLEQIQTKIGDKVDHNIHEPINTIKTGKKEQDGTILKIIQKGYKLNGKIIRAAKVEVGEFSE